MSTPFVYEIAAVNAAVQRMKPGDSQGIYAIPFYLVIGEPGAGRSTALRAMNLTWPDGDARVNTGLPQQYCTYWMAQEAAFIEPQAIRSSKCTTSARIKPRSKSVCIFPAA